MLQQLTIEHFVLIDRLELELSAGINLLSGETGAGKSIIVDALGALLGGRAGPELIRAGASRAFIEGSFRIASGATTDAIGALLETEGIEPAVPGELVVSREIGPRGSRCRIEGKQVNLDILRRLGECLVEALGQHEHQRLARAREHLSVLDRFGGGAHLSRLEAYQALYHEVMGCARRLEAQEATAADRARNLDFLRYQHAELVAANLTDGDEEEGLRHDLCRLSNVQTLRETLEVAQEALRAEDGAASRLRLALGSLRQAERLDPDLSPHADSLAGAMAVIEDVASDLRRHGERVEEDPAQLARIEARLTVLAGLTRKYGPTLAEALAHRERIEADLARAEDDDGALAEGRSLLAARRLELEQAAKDLSALRQEAARGLEEAVQRQLAELGMKAARFQVAFEHAEIGPQGAEQVEFTIAANPGEPARPLARTASGGELARVMLAIKTALVNSEPIPTLVFDEVDTGVSGKTAQAVARQIARLGERYQILLITHLPAIAAVADAHFRVEKGLEGDRTLVRVQALDDADRIHELATMASGKASPEALAHARQLLHDARGTSARV